MINSYLLAGLTRGLSLRLEQPRVEPIYDETCETETEKEQARIARRRKEDARRSFPWSLSNWGWVTR
jgi:hypothetical protein